MKTLRTLRDTSHNTAWTAGLAVTMSALPMFAAHAQQAAPAEEEELPTVTVEGEGSPDNTLEGTTGISRLPGRIQDMPQTVQVINQQTMQEQGVTTLEQALRNVPGVTVGIGEGGGGMNGDQFRIRGFQSKGDIYINGLRDFGVYVRDSFAYESVEVLKGPSSESFGAGTTGGVINSTLKQAHLGDKTDIEGQFGTGPLYRGVFDINKQLDETTAFRVVGMVNEQDVADRDHVESNRYGILADLGFGLGTDQTLHLNYLYQDGSRTPDYGVPIVTPQTTAQKMQFGSFGQPATEWGVPRSNFYGKVTDTDDTVANMFTANYKREVNDWLTITNDSRVGYYTRNFAATVPECNAACNEEFFNGGNPTISLGGGNPAFYQESWSGQNITTAIAKFNTGFLRHEVVAGLDMYFVDDERTLVSVYGNKGTQNMYDPIYADTTGYFLYRNPTGNNGQRNSSATDIGLFASDRIWLTEQLSVLGGIRYDSYSADYSVYCQYSSRATYCPATLGWVDAETTTQFWSPKASVIWEPTANQTYYASWARSYSPQGMFPTNDITVVNPSQNNLEPEENETYEAGFKISTTDGRLGFTGSLFRVDKSNAYYVDPFTLDTVETGENQRVQGVELGVTGNITRAWVIQAAYAYYDSEIQTSTTASYVGNAVPFVSENNFTLWTTYELTQDVLTQIPGKLLVGGGITYASEYYTNSANTSIIPDSFSLDALVSYEYENYRIALNAYNLTDELNYSAGWGNRAVPSSGRTFTLTVGATF